MNVLEIAERSVGASGMIQPHPLERLMRDLRTYLRQPTCGHFGLLMKQGDTDHDQNQPAELCETYGLLEEKIVDPRDEQIS